MTRAVRALEQAEANQQAGRNGETPSQTRSQSPVPSPVAPTAAPSPSALDVQHLRALDLSELTAYAQEHGVSKRQAKMATDRDDVMGLIR